MKRYWAVLSTYIHRRRFWACLGAWASALAGLPASFVQELPTTVKAVLIVVGVGYPCALIGVHLKEQLGVFRSALLPRFRAPHVVVALLFLVAAVVSFPVIAGLSGKSAFGPLGPVVPAAALAVAVQACLESRSIGLVARVSSIIFVLGLVALVNAYRHWLTGDLP